MYLLEDYARQIGVDMQNNELHGYINPYNYEINRFIESPKSWIDIEYPDFVDKIPEGGHYIPLDETPYHVIDTEEGLEELIGILKKAEVIGFDIREHSYHSYLGFICVMIVICLFSGSWIDMYKDRGFYSGCYSVTR